MLTVSKNVLKALLERFDGSLLPESSITPFHRFSLPLFSDPQKISDPRIEFTSQLDFTDAYKNYEREYKSTTGATFAAYFKWIAIKAMANTPFNWRYINHQWYQFNNLPLFIVIRKPRIESLITTFLFDVSHDSWESFCAKHSKISHEHIGDDIHPELYSAYFALAYQMEGLHIPRMTHYKTSKQVDDSHRPKIVFSDRYILEGRTYLPMHLSISHASLMPKLAEQYLDRLMTFAKQSPEKVQEEYQSLPAPTEQHSNVSLRARL